jgi:hypothetical protein
MSPMPWALATAALILITARPRRPIRSSIPTTAEPPVDLNPTETERRQREPSRRRRDDAAEVARWCESLSRAVRGGDSVLVALRAVPPPRHHAEAATTLVLEIERTGRIGPERRPVSSHMALAITVLAAIVEHGGPAAEPLDRAAAVLRGRSAERAERQVHSAQARLSAQVMSILPVAMLVLLVGTSASVRAVVTAPAGAALVGVGISLNLAGWRWMRAIIGRAAR